MCRRHRCRRHRRCRLGCFVGGLLKGKVRHLGQDYSVSRNEGRELLQAPSILRGYVGPDVPLLFDSGVRNGEGVLKALALGADFVLIGRPFLFAMAADGYPGLQQVIRRMKSLSRFGLERALNIPANFSIFLLFDIYRNITYRPPFVKFFFDQTIQGGALMKLTAAAIRRFHIIRRTSFGFMLFRQAGACKCISGFFHNCSRFVLDELEDFLEFRLTVHNQPPVSVQIRRPCRGVLWSTLSKLLGKNGYVIFHHRGHRDRREKLKYQSSVLSVV